MLPLDLTVEYVAKAIHEELEALEEEGWTHEYEVRRCAEAAIEALRRLGWKAR